MIGSETCAVAPVENTKNVLLKKRAKALEQMCLEIMLSDV